jgi:hypothetical protein
MNEYKFGTLSFIILVCASLVFIGYDLAVSFTTRLETIKWECTAASIVEGKAVCIEYKANGETK